MGAGPCRPCVDNNSAVVEVTPPNARHALAGIPSDGEVESEQPRQVTSCDEVPPNDAALGPSPAGDESPLATTWPQATSGLLLEPGEAPSADGNVIAAEMTELSTWHVDESKLQDCLDFLMSSADGGTATPISSPSTPVSRQASRCSFSRTNSRTSSIDNSFECGSVNSMASTTGSEHGSSQVHIGSKRLEHCSIVNIMYEVTRHLDSTHDILRAEELFAELKRRLSVREWDSLQETELLGQFSAQLEPFFDIGRYCCLETRDWSTDFQDSDMHIECMRDDSHTIFYRARVKLPVSLACAVAVTNELDLLPTWDPLVSSPPEVVGTRTAHRMTMRYQMNLLRGFRRFDVLSEVRRFIDRDAGFLAEAADGVPEGDPNWSAPSRGLARPPGLKTRRLWLAFGKEACVLVEVGAMGLQPRMGERLLRPFAAALLRRRALAMRNAAVSAAVADSTWEARRQSDADGLYAQLEEAARSKGSRQRSDNKSKGADESAVVIAAPSNLAGLFARDGVLRYRPNEQEPLSPEFTEAEFTEEPRNSIGRRSSRKTVHFSPGIILHCIPDRAGHREEYEFLADQHERLKKAMKAVMKNTSEEDIDTHLKNTRVACAAMERQYSP
mmetsp:Transcript_43210/g.109923  ORF Transcript_43210/g.109923 Transcript_43210/m.109923 type:complete len:614 (+) Transcript_43210:52-1893(+)